MISLQTWEFYHEFEHSVPQYGGGIFRDLKIYGVILESVANLVYLECRKFLSREFKKAIK